MEAKLRLLDPIENADRLSRAAQLALRSAAARVPDRWDGRYVDAAGRPEVTEQLEVLVAAVIAGKVADRADAETGLLRLRRRLIELIRAELIEDWSAHEDPAADGILQLLRALERVREDLEPGFEEVLNTPFDRQDELSLLVGMAHDVRSPMTSILFLADAMRRGVGEDGGETHRRRQLGIIYSAAFGLLSLVSDVVELAKGGNRLSDSDRAPFSLTETISTVYDIVQPMAEEKRLSLRRLSPDEDFRLGYPIALSRVLLNLTTNAVKFTEDGFVEVVARTTRGNSVEFSVRDTGEGIANEQMPKLWQPLRYDRRLQGFRFSGTGIGLTLSRKLVKAMGSELHVESRAGWGTRFYFELDLPPVPDRAADTPPEER